MYISEKNDSIQKISVVIPLTNGTGKTRIKKRTILNSYGVPVPTKQEKFSLDCYVEWQIGYDVITADVNKLKLTTLQDQKFIGANTKEKALYELSEYIYYFYQWKVITKESLIEMRDFLQSINTNDFIDSHNDLSIMRGHPIETNILNIKFLRSKVEYPILIYNFGKYNIITEIIIKEKQYAIGVQPMLYFCFPLSILKTDIPLLNRTATSKETANFIIDKNNIQIFIEMLKIFGILSKNHNTDIINIINLIIS